MGSLNKGKSCLFLSQDILDNLNFSNHALVRMQNRGVPFEGIWAAMEFGECSHIRGAVVYAIGRKEVALAKGEGFDLEKYMGIHVVCGEDGGIITVYRNRHMKDLKPRRKRNSSRRRKKWENSLSETMDEIANKINSLDMPDSDDEREE
ncbi:MAG TPA: DUF4258 domain-containing protein [Firmicutes bacterium]|nr:DUF4258 domain-containing protein [Bacillota bacterium]